MQRAANGGYADTEAPGQIASLSHASDMYVDRYICRSKLTDLLFALAGGADPPKLGISGLLTIAALALAGLLPTSSLEARCEGGLFFAQPAAPVSAKRASRSQLLFSNRLVERAAQRSRRVFRTMAARSRR
jgi:hypothetical protein